MNKHWLTPPELYAELDQEFHFDFDPCPYPKPDEWDALKSEWGKMNYLNPPFRPNDGITTNEKGEIKYVGPTAFVRRAIELSKKGKSSFITIPTQSYINLLLEAGAELRSLGRVKWLEVDTNEPMKGPSSITGFYLRGKQN